MPSKVISKVDTSFVSEGTCPDVCMKSCKISKKPRFLALIPSDTVDLYLNCQKNQNESTDTSISILFCEDERNNNSDGNENELTGVMALFQTAISQDDIRQFDEGGEVLPDTSEMYMKTVNQTAIDCDSIHGFDMAHCNPEPAQTTIASGNGGALGALQFFESSRSYSRIIDTTDFCSVSHVAGKSKIHESAEINMYSEQYTMLQGHEGALISHVREELENTTSLSYTDLCDEVLENSDGSRLQLNPQLEVHRQEYEFEPVFLDSGSAATLDSDFFNDLPSLLDLESTSWSSTSPRDLSSERPVTLVFDLDETLVHTTASPCEDKNFSFQLEERVLYVQRRPFLPTFLERVEELFRIIIFTAGTRDYADHILDKLDPGRRFTARRAYRDSYIFSDDSYTKDLTVLGVDLAKLAIVDNTAAVFHALQVNNGIPIKSWFGDPRDRELLSLLPFLEILAGADDVRPLIAERFGSSESS